MPQQITIEVLYPWLESLGATADQVDEVDANLSDLPATLTFPDGVATLLHRDVVLPALEGIDEHPWKDTDPVEFREYVQDEMRKTGILYWIVGADTLPLA